MRLIQAKNFYIRSMLCGLLITLCSFSSAVSPISSARNLYSKLDQGDLYVDSLIKVTSRFISSPLMLAYYGAAKTAKAKYVSGPFDKYSTAKAGLAKLNSSISKSPSNIEIRFIRYSVEINIPAVMPFTDHTKQDRKYILEHLDVNHVYYPEIKRFMLKYANLTATEKQKFT